METYATVLMYAIPGFILLIIAEYIASRMMNYPVNRAMDTISSLSSGMTNTLKDILGLSVVIVSYSWMADHLAIFHIQSTLWLYIFAFVLIDFASYWSHRFNHTINVFWNRHIVHHSSEEFNLSCALRQSISGIVGVYFFLYIPMALVGIPTEVVAITAPLHLFAQFWYHTRLIGKLGWLENIIVTPSHHRVHHAINPEYIDKNYAAIFIFWDKWFGTFQEELENVPPVYGVKRAVKTWNPILINYQHMWLLFKDAWRTRKLWDKIRLWFMPTGWRPDDVKKKYPVASIDNVYQMEKYEVPSSMPMKAWSWFQLVIHNLLMFLLLVKLADYGLFSITLYAAFLMISIFAYTSLMDRHIVALPAELMKALFGYYILFAMDGWFGIDEYIPGGTYLMATYLAFSMLVSVYFMRFEKHDYLEKTKPMIQVADRQAV